MTHQLYGIGTVDVYCGHPNMNNNSSESVGCSGKCENCRRLRAELQGSNTILKLLAASDKLKEADKNE